MSRERAFSPRTAGILAGVATASILATMLFGIFGDTLAEHRSAGADGYSRSAIGHRALIELLEASGAPLVQSRHATASKIGDAAFVALEPALSGPPGDADDTDDVGSDGSQPAADELADMVRSAPTSLIVLPKWRGTVDEARPNRVARVSPVPIDVAERVLAALDIDGHVERPASLGSWSFPLEPFAKPTLRAPQLIADSPLQPLVAGDAGVLLGFLELHAGQRVYVLSDPDVLNNHGIGKGENAVLVDQILELLRAGGNGGVVLDETLHGFRQAPSLWRALFEPPLVFAGLQALLTVGLLLWAASARFGKPAPTAPPIAPGKRYLIDNISALTRFGGHTAQALDRYLDLAVSEVAGRLHAPTSLRGDDLHRWIDQVADNRGLRLRTSDLEAEVARSRAGTASTVACARRIHAWKQELIHGSRSHSRNR